MESMKTHVKITTHTVSREEIWKHPERRPREYIRDLVLKNLKAKKMSQLGCGAYAAVYEHPDGKHVIKIAISSKNYLHYAMWCAQHQDNPYVPRIKSIDEYIIKDEDTARGFDETVAVVVMEKLRRVMDRTKFNSTVMRYLEYGVFKKYPDDPVQELKPCQLKRLTPIREYLKAARVGIDVHCGNIMWRGACQLVITDPVIG